MAVLGSLEPVDAEQLRAIQAQFAILPSDYLHFLANIGSGVLQTRTYSIYSGPCAYNEIYEPVSDPGLSRLLVFGDDMSGYCAAFDPDHVGKVVELDPYGEWHNENCGSFIDFLCRILVRAGADIG